MLQTVTSTPTPEVPAVCTVLGVDYRVSDLATAASSVVDRAQSGHGGYCCLAGVHGIVTAQRRANLKLALDGAWANFPDGEPVAWLMRRLGAADTRRVAGPDLMPMVFDAGQAAGIRHFLFGSSPQVLERLEGKLRMQFPRARIVGTMSPPFRPLTEDEEIAIAEQIRSSNAQIVWVGLGLPKQDEWMRRNAPRLQPCLAMGVGAAFDFLSGTKPRAPLWMREHGLEWLHRLMTEPRRLGWRYLSTNSEFMVRAAVAVVAHRVRRASEAEGRRRR